MKMMNFEWKRSLREIDPGLWSVQSQFSLLSPWFRRLSRNEIRTMCQISKHFSKNIFAGQFILSALNQIACWAVSMKARRKDTYCSIKFSGNSNGHVVWPQTFIIFNRNAVHISIFQLNDTSFFSKTQDSATVDSIYMLPNRITSIIFFLLWFGLLFKILRHHHKQTNKNWSLLRTQYNSMIS